MAYICRLTAGIQRVKRRGGAGRGSVRTASTETQCNDEDLQQSNRNKYFLKATT